MSSTASDILHDIKSVFLAALFKIKAMRYHFENVPPEHAGTWPAKDSAQRERIFCQHVAQRQ